MDEDSQKRKWTYEQLRGGDSVLTMQAGCGKFASQRGMTGFGMPRLNLTSSKDQGGQIQLDRRGNDTVRIQAGDNTKASQKGLSPMLGFRSTVPKIVYRPDMVAGCDKVSEALVPQQAGSNKYASQSGEVVMGARRNQVSKLSHMPDNRQSDIIPFQSGTNIYASQSGMKDPPGIGAFRLTVVESEGLNFTEEMTRKSGGLIPWWSSAGSKFASQKGSGGFGKSRDVLSKTCGGPELAEEKARLGDGVLRLQSGTNKFASQRGMTGFGSPRDNTLKCKWKEDWTKEWSEAEAEFEASGRGNRHQRDPITGALVISQDSSAKENAPISEAQEDSQLESSKSVEQEISDAKDDSKSADVTTSEKEDLSTGKDVSSLT